MSMIDHEQSFSVPYSLYDTVSALTNFFNKSSEYEVDKVDKLTNTIYVKAGVSLFSWGENITINISESKDLGTIIQVLSTPKTGIMFGGAMDMGKNRKNIRAISEGLSNELAKFEKIEISKKDNVSFTDEIIKMGELLEKGLITQDEFDQKKKQILGI